MGFGCGHFVSVELDGIYVVVRYRDRHDHYGTDRICLDYFQIETNQMAKSAFKEAKKTQIKSGGSDSYSTFHYDPA
jgi:hypothetical protein